MLRREEFPNDYECNDYCNIYIENCINTKFFEHRNDPNLIHYGKIGYELAIKSPYCDSHFIEQSIEGSINRYLIGCKTLLSANVNGKAIFINNEDKLRVLPRPKFYIGRRRLDDVLEFEKFLGMQRYINTNIFDDILKCVIDNESIEDFRSRLKTIPIGFIVTNHLEVVGIPNVCCGRDYDNNKQNTFDYITVTMPIAMSGRFKEAIDFVNINSKLLGELAFMSIEQDKIFKKCDIPVNFLKITDCILTRSFELVFTFGFKIKEGIS